VFKRRKPEEPTVLPARGHVVAAERAPDSSRSDSARPDPAWPDPARPDPSSPRQTTDLAASGAPDLTFVIPAMPYAMSPQPSPVTPTPPQLKEPTLMSRPPLQPTPTAPTMPHNMVQGLSRTPLAPARMPPQAGERRTLVVGRGISVQGTITDAERLVVEGTVEASSLNAAELQIAQGGVLKGQVEVEDAEISGLMDGILTVKGSLVLRGSGQVIGEARCRRLQVEDGGQLSGKISMITDATPAASFITADVSAG
jgi:cytoskeletal protein CcmA (bactofilin family)